MAYQDRSKLKSDLSRRYGISTLIYTAILAGSDHRCMICGEHSDEIGTLNLDHDHSSGKLRGCVCRNCNLGLANFHDDPALLRKAADYLEDA